MAYVSFYRKYRPQTFDELVGQEHVSSTLAKAILEDRVAHAYLFTGPRGTGKTSTARILAKSINCEQGPTPNPCGKCPSCVAITDGSSLDVIEMDAASHSKVDDAREILAGVPLAAAGARRKVYVIDEVHMLSTQAFNALLKTLEEPPPHVVFILATTEAHKVLPTIVSRTQRFDFRRVSHEELTEHLERVAKSEGMEVDSEALAVIARHSEGSVRDALSTLDQLSNLGPGATARDAERLLGERGLGAFSALFDSIIEGRVGEVFERVNTLVVQGSDPRQLAEGALAHARSLLLLATAPDATGLLDMNEGDAQMLAQQAERFTPGELVRILDLLGRAVTEMRNAPNHRLFLEVALVRAAAPETDPASTGLLGRVERLERRIGIGRDEVSQAAPAEAPAREQRARAAVQPRRDAAAVAANRPAQAPGPSHDETPASAAAAPATGPGQPSAGEQPGVPAGALEAIGLGHIREAWSAALQEVSKASKRVWALLNPSQALAYDGRTLVVEVQSPFHKSSMESPANRSMLADGLHAALGIRPDLEFVERGAPPPQAAGAEAAQPRGDSGRSAEAPSSADPDPDPEEPLHDLDEDPIELVRKGLGAEVVEERHPD